MKKLIIILLFIITSGIFSKTNDVFLHEFGISDKSIEYYNNAKVEKELYLYGRIYFRWK